MAAEVGCGWFARCGRAAVGIVRHPVLKAVPVCARCAGVCGLDLEPGRFDVVDDLATFVPAEVSA